MTEKADMLGVAANPLFQIFKNLPGMVIWPFDFLDFPSATTNLKKCKITSEWRDIKPLRFKFQSWGAVDDSEAAAAWARAVLSTLMGLLWWCSRGYWGQINTDSQHPVWSTPRWAYRQDHWPTSSQRQTEREAASVSQRAKRRQLVSYLHVLL